MLSVQRTRLTLLLTAVCLIALSANVLGSSVALVNGTTYDAQLVGFFTFNNVDHFVFQMADGSLMAYSRAEIESIQINPGEPPAGGIPLGQATQPPAGAQPSAVTQPPVAATPPSMPPAPVFDLSGTWSINANQFLGELSIAQNGTALSGTVLGNTLGDGRVQPDGTVSFNRLIGNTRQVYTGIVARDASGGLTMQGTFDCPITGGKDLPWSAVLAKPSSESATATQPPAAAQPPAATTPPLASPAPAFDLSGTWRINANQSQGTLSITQSGTTLSGTVLGNPLGNGRVQPDGTVSFDRVLGSNKQTYTGKVAHDASGNLTMQGTFDCTISGKGYRWSAVLTKPSSGSAPTTQPTSTQPAHLRSEREPNNDIASANPIAIGTDVTGAIDTNGDIDVYKVTVPTHGTFHVTCTQPADFYMAILNEAGTQIVGGDLGSPGKTMVLDADVFEPGNYYILVRGYSSSHKSDTPYTLRAEFREARDAFEPNDNIQQASTVVSGKQFDSFIYRPGDVDYYRIDVSWPASIKVASTQPADCHLSLVDSSGAKQLYGGDFGAAGSDMLLEGDVYEPGTYYVVMRGYSANHYNMHTPYTMTITVTPGGPDRFEPNDAPEQASVPPLGQPFAAFISRPGDKDYYKVNIAGPSQIVVESDQPADYWMGILRPDGATVLTGDDYGSAGKPMAAAHYVFEPGAYYVLMRGYGANYYNMHVPYNMKIDVKPALNDPAEPNDSASQAKGLQLGQPVNGVIPIETDQDWWYFDTPLLGKVRITCTQPADFRLRVVDSAGKDVTNQDLGGKGALMDLTLQLLPMSRYYVVVQPWSKGHFNMHEAYQLTVSTAR
jgi:hypothetical protein